ncbi:hypothetical protein H920_01949 [Fukomys damarensis]|uniref:Uncharacterized protein n=1 Tax=Fukomys damarensis TaxID=885580 RepID=A0A091E236_FUKDA|nr:hypothetical protein H920_01949 [Fukomys damarensis]
MATDDPGQKKRYLQHSEEPGEERTCARRSRRRKHDRRCRKLPFYFPRIRRKSPRSVKGSSKTALSENTRNSPGPGRAAAPLLRELSTRSQPGLSSPCCRGRQGP